MIVLQYTARTCDESLGFNDKPIRVLLSPRDKPHVPQRDGYPLWILTIALLFTRRVPTAEVMVGGVRQWCRTSVSICAALQRNGRPPSAQLPPRPVSGTASLPKISPAAPLNAVPQAGSLLLTLNRGFSPNRQFSAGQDFCRNLHISWPSNDSLAVQV